MRKNDYEIKITKNRVNRVEIGDDAIVIHQLGDDGYRIYISTPATPSSMGKRLRIDLRLNERGAPVEILCAESAKMLNGQFPAIGSTFDLETRREIQEEARLKP